MELLKNKIALISGASRGIGAAIAKCFAQEKAKVAIIFNKSEKEAEILKNEIVQNDGECLMFKGSVADFSRMKEIVKAIKENWGKIDILVNNAGIIKDKPLLLMNENEWDEVINTNLKGAFFLTKASLSTMIAQKQGKIINISSLTAMFGRPGQTNYGSAKAGLLGFTKSLARELAPYGILVNSIIYGLIDTQMTKSIPRPILEDLKKLIPLGRVGTPQEAANAALFLASTLSSYITGATLNVTGGEYM
jgi:3-oxoacyl-[acyl-carrier protein] reductase